MTNCGCARLKPEAAAYVGTPRSAPAPAPPRQVSPATGAQAALNKFHDAHSPIGRTRRMTSPAEDDEAGVVTWQFDPFTPRGD